MLGNFSALEDPTDKGAIWETFLISELLKKLSYNASLARPKFCTTHQQQEIDYVKELSGQFLGFEFK